MGIKIGDLAKLTECQVETIRYYEKEGLLPSPPRSAGNFRIYGEAHVERLQFIRHCRSLGMSLTDVRTLLGYRDIPSEDCGAINALLDQHIRQVEVRVAELIRLKDNLTALRESCAGSRPTPACGILEGLVECSSHRGAGQGTRHG